MGRKATDNSPEGVARRKRGKKHYDKKKFLKEMSKGKLQTVPPEGAPANSASPSTQKNATSKSSVGKDSNASELNSNVSNKTIPTKIPTLYLPPGFSCLLHNRWFWEALEHRQQSGDDFTRYDDPDSHDAAYLIADAELGNYAAVQGLIDRYPELIRLKQSDVEPWLKNPSEFAQKFEQEAAVGVSPPLKGGTLPPTRVDAVRKTTEQAHLRLVPPENSTEVSPTNGLHKENELPKSAEETGTTLESIIQAVDVKGPPLRAVRHTFDVLSSLNATARDVKEELLWCREVMRRNAPRAVFTEMCCLRFLRGIETEPEQLAKWQQEYESLFPETEDFQWKAPESAPVLRPAWVAPVEEESVPAGFDASDPSTYPEEWGFGWRGGVWRGGKRIEPSLLPPIPNERLCAFIVKMFGATQSESYLERTWTAEEEGLIDEVYSQAVGFVADPDHAYALLLAWMTNYAIETRREPQDGVQIGHTPAELLRDLVKYAKPVVLDYPREQWATAASIFERLEKFRARYIWGFEHGR
jgi:hypothetical protein